MGRTDWFRRHPYDESFRRSQDLELWCRTIDSSHFAQLDEPLLFYRQPNRINLSAYYANCRADRNIIRLHGRRIAGRTAVPSLLVRSHAKELLYRMSARLGFTSLLVRAREQPLDPSSRRSADDILETLLRTPVPGIIVADVRT
jgi:hypothetical protein